MSSADPHGSSRLHRLTLAERCALLGLVVVMALPLMAGIAWRLQEMRGVIAAIAAATICWICSTVALVLTARSRGPNMGLKGLLFGMVFQMGVPLMIGIILSQSGGPLAAGGVFGWIVVFHLLTLTAKTILVLPLLNPRKSTVAQGA